jgi:RNA polymerase sigma factor for flagellar operon FliA
MSTVAVSTALDREQLILAHLPQVRLLALRQHRRCPSEALLEDLVSVATVGLIQAVDRFDPNRKLKLKTLAEHRIRGAMLDYLRKLDPLSRPIRQFQRRREVAVQRLQGRSGNTPADSEVASELKLSLPHYRILERAAQGSIVLNLESMTAKDQAISAQGNSSGIEEMDLLRGLDSAIRNLPEPERSVIHAVRVGISDREIARRLHRPQLEVSRIKSNGIRRLRMALGISSVSSRAPSER